MTEADREYARQRLAGARAILNGTLQDPLIDEEELERGKLQARMEAELEGLDG